MNGRLRILQWDETAVDNRVTVPSGHIWKLAFLAMKYVADSQAATRNWELRFSWALGPNDFGMFASSIIADQTEEYLWSATKEQSPTDLQQTSAQGLWLVSGDSVKFQVANEQSGDLWDIWGPIEDYVVPRA